MTPLIVTRPRVLDSIPGPQRLTPRPMIHRTRRKPEWYEDKRLRGKDFWKAIGMTLAATALMFFAWYYGGM